MFKMGGENADSGVGVRDPFLVTIAPAGSGADLLGAGASLRAHFERTRETGIRVEMSSCFTNCSMPKDLRLYRHGWTHLVSQWRLQGALICEGRHDRPRDADFHVHTFETRADTGLCSILSLNEIRVRAGSP
jgi:hypothetical protein